MVIIKMTTYCLPPQRFHLRHRPFSSWSNVNVKPIAQHKRVHARNTTWLAQTSVCVEMTVKMMQTVTPNMTLRRVMKIYTNIPSKWYRPGRSYVYNLYYYLVTGMSVLLLYRTMPKTNYICQVNGVKLADIMFSLFSVCVSVHMAKTRFVTTSPVFAVKM